MLSQTNPEIGFRSYASLSQAHTHPFVQIVLPSRGVLDLDITGRGGRVDRDCAAVIGAGERHAFSAATAGNRFLVLDIAASQGSPTGSADSQLGYLSERRYVSLTPAAHYLIAYAEQILDSSRAAHRSDGRARSLWLELLLDALQRESATLPDRPTRALARAKAFIERSFDQPIKMGDVARVAGLGASRLYELFQERLGITPGGYLAEVRLRHALALLGHTRLSIAEVAARTGHADQSTLTRHLRRACSITPAAYRRGIVSQAGGSAKPAGDKVKNR